MRRPAGIVTLCFAIGLALCAPESAAQTWVRGVIPSGTDAFADVSSDLDDTTVLVGTTTSWGAGGEDVWVVKVDDCGGVAWERTFGGQGDDSGAAIIPLSPLGSGYLVAATTRSFGNGTADLWVLRLDAAGNLIDERVYDAGYDETAVDLLDTEDGGYAVLGNLALTQQGVADIVLLEIAADLDPIVAWSYGGSGLDEAAAFELSAAPDGYVVVGSSDSFGLDRDLWVLALDGDGAIVRERTYDGVGADRGADLLLSGLEGGARYTIVGETGSANDGEELWVLTLETDLAVDWSRVYGGAGNQSGHSISFSLLNPGYVVVGENDGSGGGGADAWMLRLEPGGSVAAQKTIGTTDDERLQSVREVFAGQFVAAGTRAADAFVVRLSADTLEVEGGCPLVADTVIEDVSLTPQVGFPTSFELEIGVQSFQGDPATSAPLSPVNLVCTGRPSEVSGLEPTRGSRRVIQPLEFTGKEEMTWESSEFNCADYFNVYSGGLLELRQLSFGECLVSPVEDNQVTVTKTPSPGEGLFLLVSGVNETGEGSLGFTSFDVERVPQFVCP